MLGGGGGNSEKTRFEGNYPEIRTGLLGCAASKNRPAGRQSSGMRGCAVPGPARPHGPDPGPGTGEGQEGVAAARGASAHT